jgi:hypothetical protein
VKPSNSLEISQDTDIIRALIFLFALYLLSVPRAVADHHRHSDELIEESEWAVSCPRDIAACNTAHFAGPFEVNVTRPSRPADVQLIQSIEERLTAPVKVKLSFRSNSKKHNTIHVVYQLSNPPYTKVWDKEMLISQDQIHYVDEIIPANTPKQYSLCFQLGKVEGVVQLDKISLRIKGPLAGPDPPAAFTETIMAVRRNFTPDKMDARIKAIRCGHLSVTVQDKLGRPIPGAKVEVKQLRHQFLFGCNLNGLKPDDHSESQRNYQKRFLDLFNYATLPCTWDMIEPTRGKHDYAEIDSTSKWCLEHHIKAKGRALIEQWSDPSWLPKEPATAVPLARAMVTDCVKHLGKSVQAWDLVSDVVSAVDSDEHNFLCAWLKQEEKKRAVAGEQIAKRKATSVVAESALLWAQAAAGGKDETFILSDASMGDEADNMYVLLEQSNSLPNGVGISTEMLVNKRRWGLDHLYLTISRFARFAPVHLTAITVLSGDDKQKIDWDKTYTDWVSTARGEADQSSYVELMYRILFSHPNVASISWFDLSDKGSYLGAPGGLLRRNGSPKPAYNKLMELIHQEWWTNASGTTHPDGSFSTPAFFGDYQISVSASNGRTARQQVDFRASKDVVIRF